MSRRRFFSARAAHQKASSPTVRRTAKQRAATAKFLADGHARRRQALARRQGATLAIVAAGPSTWWIGLEREAFANAIDARDRLRRPRSDDHPRGRA